MNFELKKALYRIQKNKTNLARDEYNTESVPLKAIQDEERALQTKLMQNAIIYSGERVGNKMRLMSPPQRSKKMEQG